MRRSSILNYYRKINFEKVSIVVIVEDFRRRENPGTVSLEVVEKEIATSFSFLMGRRKISVRA